MIESSYRRSSHLAEEEEDRISKLPDDILVSIISLMMKGEEGEIEQVVRTSLLSRRWRFLWKYSLKSLAFTFKERNYVDPQVLYAVFVDRVHHILSLRDTIDDFSLTFTKRYKPDDHLRGWIESALKKRVKRLGIKLDHDYVRDFTLDNKVIRNHNMDSLVSLCLDEVDVSGKFLEYLLTICGSLEHLSVSRSKTLVDFTVSGLRLKLKYLKIFACWKLKHLYIRDVNLFSFEYCDRSCSTVVIENTPHLVNAHIIGGGNAPKFFSIGKNTEGILRSLPLLQTLVLEFNIGLVRRPALDFPKLWNLVRLELQLKILIRPDFSCAVCSHLLASSPLLQKLKIVFQFLTDKYNEDEDEVERLEHPHESLKVLEIVGFIGCKLDTGVAWYIIENTVSLDKIFVDTSHPHRDEGSKTREKAREKAKEHLGTRLLHTRPKFVLK